MFGRVFVIGKPGSPVRFSLSSSDITSNSPIQWQYTWDCMSCQLQEFLSEVLTPIDSQRRSTIRLLPIHTYNNQPGMFCWSHSDIFLLTARSWIVRLESIILIYAIPWHMQYTDRISSYRSQSSIGPGVCMGLSCNSLYRLPRGSHWESGIHKYVSPVPRISAWTIYLIFCRALFGTGTHVLCMPWLKDGLITYT